MQGEDSSAQTTLSHRAAFSIPLARLNRVGPNTRQGYKYGINKITKWVRSSNNEHLLTDNAIDLDEFQYTHFLQFMQSMIQESQVAVSTLSGYRSAIKNLYKVQAKPLPAEYGDDMKEVFQGIKRLIAVESQTSDRKETGKRPLSYSIYEDACVSSLMLQDYGFCHLFLTLSWNLMCRSRSTETVRLQHLSFQDDSFGVTFFQTKTDQEGSKPKEPRHCYANPLKPQTCVVLALGVYLACCPQLENGALFPGSKQKDRFGKCLVKLLVGDNDGKKSRRSYGTHSIRKGVTTFACSGSTVGPSLVSVCLRCGWSLGDVMERYIRYESAGDPYLGRVVAGLPLDKRQFALLPPHFAKQDTSVDCCLQVLEEKVLEEKGVGCGNISRQFLESTINAAISNVASIQARVSCTPIETINPSYTVFAWAGWLHKLPEDFDFPSVDIAMAWRLWWLGNSMAKHPPYREIDTRDLSTPKKARVFSGWKYLMKHLTECYQRHTQKETGVHFVLGSVECISTCFFLFGASQSFYE
ncbi:hypothetical protein LEN26_014929 [Aphanomyces euteiches]|nr:hypothetical protein LEN26_014929 [Aphanomyces euteiches]KAH9106049.1 hypothetical protein AeMF1_018231 [Aphanomyces euteiches]KAH9192610.1 hypothetical protein AeNC1_005404 [Aphanomyces euteiches]